ncbi:hypothetical protein H072_487 [Dactylellina haptotyla CBS 200.50]|uniref:Methyltransferase type 11 domain-containing protein n=1 Tax=Dactylellina haptotyla (strain CBS 200.50) TaxID=1284197 RepID=S8AX16_DACHA|nr:hypothetical protein H072_487 [Dactylellina haptotyla CBS 200.50]
MSSTSVPFDPVHDAAAADSARLASTNAGSTFHPLASSAFTTSGGSGLYDRARPSYPSEALNLIFAALKRSTESNTAVPNRLNVLELGAGTGIFSRLLVSPPDGVDTQSTEISKLVAVEPASGMRAGFKSGMAGIGAPTGETGPNGDEKVQVIDGTFDNIPVPDGWADAVVIAQAFHWSHGHYESTLRSLARVLRPQAPLILLWNLEDRLLPDIHPWVPKIRDIYEAHEKETPQYRLMWWKAIFDLQEFKEGFDPDYQYSEVKRVLPTTVQGVVDRVVSKSYITDLGDEDRANVENGVKDVLKNEKKKWIDEANGVFEYPYATDLYVIWRK